MVRARGKEWHHLGKGQSGAWYTDEDLAFGSKILVDDDRTGCALFGAFKEGTVLGEGEVARAGAVGGLEAGEGMVRSPSTFPPN